MQITQFFDLESCTFTYLLTDHETRLALIIDPVIEHADLYLQHCQTSDITLSYTLETHTHADHITAAATLRQQTNCKIVMGKQSQAQGVDIHLDDGETIAIGQTIIQAMTTPGHTDDSVCYLCEDAVFTGDTLLIRSTGRTDFQSGSPLAQYASITDKLFTLPDNRRVFPAHDYKVITQSTIGDEKRYNPRLQVQSAAEYATIMNTLKLEHPRKMDIAVPANLHCGDLENTDV